MIMNMKASLALVLTALADRDGMVRFRGFKGKYEVHYVE